jgi:hypothetical protein
LAEASTHSDEARLIVAERALRSGIWASASSMLEEVSLGGQTNKYFLLASELAVKKQSIDPENKDASSLKGKDTDNNLEKEAALLAAAHAPHAARWHCLACDDALVQWEMACPSCGVLGQVDWVQSQSLSRLALENKESV